jgi:hypothetical protein
MKWTGLFVVAVLFGAVSAEAVNLNQLMKQKIQEAANKKSPPPPAPAPAPQAAVPAAPAPAPQAAASSTYQKNLGDFIKKTLASTPQATSTCFNPGTPIPKNLADSTGRMLYCYFSSLVSLEQIQKWVGQPLFVSGPHKEKLDFYSRKSFGQYNKEFVSWIYNQVLPILVEPSFRSANQEVFNTYLKPSLFKIYSGILFATTNSTTFQQMIAAYRKQLDSPEGVESSFNTLYPLMANRPNPLSSTPEAVGFWVRRSIDGTAETLMYSLLTVLHEYAPEDLKNMDKKLKEGLIRRK